MCFSVVHEAAPPVHGWLQILVAIAPTALRRKSCSASTQCHRLFSSLAAFAAAFAAACSSSHAFSSASVNGCTVTRLTTYIGGLPSAAHLAFASATISSVVFLGGLFDRFAFAATTFTAADAVACALAVSTFFGTCAVSVAEDDDVDDDVVEVDDVTEDNDTEDDDVEDDVEDGVVAGGTLPDPIPVP